eukprot:gene10415-biopygen21311
MDQKRQGRAHSSRPTGVLSDVQLGQAPDAPRRTDSVGCLPVRSDRGRPRFPGYTAHRRDRATGEDGCGVVILVVDGRAARAAGAGVAPGGPGPGLGVKAAGVRLYPDRAKYFRRARRLQPPPDWIGPRAFVCVDLNLHAREWDKACAGGTVKGDHAAAGKLLEWVHSTRRRIVNDGRATRMSGAQKGSENVTAPGSRYENNAPPRCHHSARAATTTRAGRSCSTGAATTWRPHGDRDGVQRRRQAAARSPIAPQVDARKGRLAGLPEASGG